MTQFTCKLFVVATAVWKHLATLSTGYRRLPHPIVGNAILLRFSDRARPRHCCILCCNTWNGVNKTFDWWLFPLIMNQMNFAQNLLGLNWVLSQF